MVLCLYEYLHWLLGLPIIGAPVARVRDRIIERYITRISVIAVLCSTLEKHCLRFPH